MSEQRDFDAGVWAIVAGAIFMAAVYLAATAGASWSPSFTAAEFVLLGSLLVFTIDALAKSLGVRVFNA